MTAHQGIRVGATTASSPSPSGFEHLRINYVYGGDKRDEPFSDSMAESSVDRKRQRLARLAELDAIRPPLTQLEIACRLGVSPKTLRSYRREAGAS